LHRTVIRVRNGAFLLRTEYADSNGKTGRRLVVSNHFKQEQITHRNTKNPIIAHQIALRQEKNGEKGTILHQEAGQRPAFPDQVADGGVT
jgi:hypothetical protein